MAGRCQKRRASGEIVVPAHGIHPTNGLPRAKDRAPPPSVCSPATTMQAAAVAMQAAMVSTRAPVAQRRLGSAPRRCSRVAYRQRPRAAVYHLAVEAAHDAHAHAQGAKNVAVTFTLHRKASWGRGGAGAGGEAGKHYPHASGERRRSALAAPAAAQTCWDS